MRRPHRFLLVAVVATVVALVAACTGNKEPRALDRSNATTTTVAKPSKSAEEQAGEAASSAFTQLLQVENDARQDPLSRDWEPEIRKYAADPAAYTVVQSVRSYATLGLRQVGDSRVRVQVTQVNLQAPGGPTVAITGCFDSQSSRAVRVDTSEPVPPGTPPRFVWDITVTQYQSEPGQPWLVSTLEPRTDQPC